MRLTPSLDSGDHCDFVGKDNRNHVVRIDVTSNVDFKIDELDEFGPYIPNYEYIVAEMETNDATPIFYPLAFHCPENGCDGKLIHFVSISLEDISRAFQQSEYQEIISICTEQPIVHSFVCERLDYYTDISRNVYHNAEYDVVELNESEIDKRFSDHYLSEARYYSKKHKYFIGAISERDNHLFWKDYVEYGDKVIWMTDWATKLAGDLTGEILDLSWI